MPIDRLFNAAVSVMPAPLQPLLRRIDPDFIRFAAVGAAGFLIDLAVLTVLVRFAGYKPEPVELFGFAFTLSAAMQARFISFPIAVAATWMLNRNWTFKESVKRPILTEIFSYLAVQGSGGIANVGAYCLMLVLLPPLQAWPIIPLIAGSAVGLCLTFLGSKYWAFRR